MTMRAVVLSLLVIVLTAVPVGAQKGGEESLACLATQTSGSGVNLFQTCVSDTGNVLLFRTRQGGGDNISSDGYMICDSATDGPFNARAWSRGSPEDNFSFPTTKTSTSNVRTTADGRYRLSQTFTRDAVDKQMIITMTLKNLGPGGVSFVYLQRFIDVDADGSTSNIYVRGADSILATSSDGGHGLVMGTLTPEIQHSTFVTTFGEFDSFDHDDCQPNLQENCPACGDQQLSTPTAAGDHVGYIRFLLGSLAAGASKTVKIYYRKY